MNRPIHRQLAACATPAGVICGPRLPRGAQQLEAPAMPSNRDLAAFISDNFQSVWALEILLFLKNNPSTAWQQASLVEALRASDLIVTNSLGALEAGGLIVSENDGSTRYSPASTDLRQLVDQSEALYAKKPDAVRRMIVSSTGIAAFADSFRLGSE